MLMMPEPLTEAQTVCYNLPPHPAVFPASPNTHANAHIFTKQNCKLLYTHTTREQTIVSIPAWLCARADCSRTCEGVLPADTQTHRHTSVHTGEQVNEWRHSRSPPGYFNPLCCLIVTCPCSVFFQLCCPPQLHWSCLFIIITAIYYLTC